MEVVWTERARARLRELHAYITERAPLRAPSVIARLIDRAERLGSAPLSGHRLIRWPGDELREILERPYRIIYRVTPTRIEIITVKHYRQRLAERPNEL
ncbi:MAG: type II toxin-antitoxin system RelE/ParE family toxin [Gammaproteobacteria bacterium]